MAEIHPTAIVEGDVTLADDVVVGPRCLLTGPVTIGAGTRLIADVNLHGPLTLGARNTIYPGTSLGYAPQSVSYDHDRPGAGLVIGDDNVIRECVTMHRAMTDEGPTRVGNHNYIMVGSHAGHDVQIGNRCIIANNTLLGGHVVLEDRVVTGGGAGVHQFCRIGRGAMLSGGVATNRDVAPFFMLTTLNACGSINLVGLRRSGMSHEEIDDVRWVFRIVHRGRLSPRGLRERLEERADRPMIQEYLRFIDASVRGLCSSPREILKRGILRP